MGAPLPRCSTCRTTTLAGTRSARGDPPFKSARGVGGLGPIIINGLPYGVGNLCKRPAKCPPTGPIPPSSTGYVQQRNNSTYADQQSRSPATGKTILACNKSQGKLLVIVRPNGVNGTTFDDIKASLMILGCDNAVFMDGSDSAMLWPQGYTEVAQGANKDETNTVALAFYL